MRQGAKFIAVLSCISHQVTCATGSHAAQPRSILEEAGFTMRQSDGDYFQTYVEYLVYELVDKTFALRVGRDRELHRYYTTAVKHVEEKMGYRRSVLLYKTSISA